MKQNILLLSFLEIKLTTLLHNLQFPSKRIIYFPPFFLSSAIRFCIKREFIVIKIKVSTYFLSPDNSPVRMLLLFIIANFRMVQSWHAFFYHLAIIFLSYKLLLLLKIINSNIITQKSRLCSVDHITLKKINFNLFKCDNFNLKTLVVFG